MMSQGFKTNSQCRVSSCSDVYSSYLTTNQKNKPKYDNSIPCKVGWRIYKDRTQTKGKETS